MGSGQVRMHNEGADLSSAGSDDMLTRNILNYAIGLREQTTRQFDQANATRLERTLGDINMVTTLKLFALIEGCDIRLGAQFDAFALTTRSLDVLVSALHMARQRAVLETLTLLRVALEAACTSHHICKDEAAYAQYVQGRYKSTASITYMRKHIPFIGKVWGVISNACVHPSRRFFGPELAEDQDGETVATVSLHFAARPPEPGLDAVLLNFISLVTMILLKVLEDFLTEESSLLKPGGRRMVGTNWHLLAGHADTMLTKYYQQLMDSIACRAKEEGETQT